MHSNIELGGKILIDYKMGPDGDVVGGIGGRGPDEWY